MWDFDLSNDNKIVLLACNDGSVRAIRIKKNDLYLEKQFSKLETKILSIKFSKSGNGDIFYTGHSDGSIQRWDYKANQIVLTMNSNTKNKNMIWALCSINEKFLASGDSSGTFRIWDSKFGVLTKEFKEHEADILSICLNNNVVYFSGSDSLICSCELNDEEWILTSRFRGQSHDIQALCLLDEKLLISGGLTTDICLYKLTEKRFIEKYDKKVNTNVKRHVSGFEQKQKIYYANQNDNLFILHRKLETLDLWLANENNIEKVILLAELRKKNESHIISANISKNAKYIAYSDSDNVVIFQYNYEENDLKKLKTLKNVVAKFLFFTSDEKYLLCLNQNKGLLNIYDIQKQIYININFFESKNEVKIILNSCLSLNDKYIAFSTLDKKLLLISINFNSKSEKDNIFYLPHPSDNYITQLKFLDNNTLLTISDDNKFFLIDIKNKKFNSWTNKNLNNFPSNYLAWYNKILGVTPLSKNDKFLLFTDYNYIQVDLTKEIPLNSIIEKDKAEKLRNADWVKMIGEYHREIFNDTYKGLGMAYNQVFKNINGQNEQHTENKNKNENFKITNRFSSILFMDYIEDKNSLLVIENDWNKIIKNFPETVAKYNYGN